MVAGDLILLGAPLAFVPGLMLCALFLVMWDTNRGAIQYPLWAAGFLLDSVAMAITPVQGFGPLASLAWGNAAVTLSLCSLGLVAAGLLRFLGRAFDRPRLLVVVGSIALVLLTSLVYRRAAAPLFALLSLGVYAMFAWRLRGGVRAERIAGWLFLGRGLCFASLGILSTGEGFLLRVELMQFLALGAGIALLCASFQRAVAEVQGANRLLAVVEEAFSRLSGLTERSSVYLRVGALLRAGTNGGFVAIYELDRGRNLLCLRASEGSPMAPFELPATSVREVLRDQRAVSGAGGDAGLEALLPGAARLACFPLLYGVRVFGVGFLSLGASNAASAQVLAALEAVGRAAGFALASSEQSDRLRHTASHDLVTGLANRSALHDEYELRRDQGGLERGAIVLLVGLATLREINRIHGHYAGDRLLERSARRLEQLCAGREALAVRLGGAEFALIYYQQNEPLAAAALAAQALATFETPFETDGASIRVSAVIGIAIAPDNVPDDREMIRRGEIAMSTARAIGQPWMLYDPDMEAALRTSAAG